MNSKKWQIIGKSGPRNVDQIVKILLSNRGLSSKKQVQDFFNPRHPVKLSLNELKISQKEINKTIARIKKAIKNKQKVIVYGDYDADGITGTAVLWECLWNLGVDVLPYIPERFSEGYGLNIESLKKLKSNYPSLGLVITVDHGIVASKKIDSAKALGVDIVITDHHEPEALKPNSFSLIHTQKIGGAAVAWILSREIRKKFKKPITELGLGLDLVAIGTIADQLSLVGANRSFVKHGLNTLSNTKRPGLLALFEDAGLKIESIRPYEVGFIIAPRLNSMGRLEHAIESLRLLCTKNLIKARSLSKLLASTNTRRQKTVEETVLHARELVSQNSMSNVIFLAHERYHEGVIGLAAAALVEEFYRPSIVVSIKKEFAKASARSIPGFNIIEAIRKLDYLLVEGGGHPMAAGFTIKTEKIEEFTQKFQKITSHLLTKDILEKKLKIDLELDFNQINWELCKAIVVFEPTGVGNPTPTFVTKSVKAKDTRLVGREQKHLKLKVEDKEGITFDAIAFNMGEIYSSLSSSTPIDIAYQIEENDWNDKKSIQLKIKDIKVV